MTLQTALDWGLAVIQSIARARTPALNAVMEGFTSLGNAETYLLLVPLLFWTLELSLAIRLGIAFIASGYLNTLVKDMLMQPRPCDWADVCISDAEGYGLPSGHAQSAVLIWGLLAHQIRRGWFWGLAVLMMLLVGFSRVYLGVHFPTDVLGGWVLGAVLLLIYLRWGRQIEAWLRGLGWQAQVLLVVLLGLVLFALHPVRDVAAAVATLAGLGLGLTLMQRYVPFSPSGPLPQRIVRFVLGFGIVLMLYAGLRIVLPAEGAPGYVPLRMLRYVLVGLWITLGGPWLFLKLGLAPRRAEVSG